MFGDIQHKPQLTICNYPKGGDFMKERDIPGPVSTDKGTVLDSRGDPTHPLRKGRIAPVTDPIDRVFEEMDMAGGRRPNPFEGKDSIAFK